MTTSTSLGYLIALPLAGSIILLLAGRKADKWGHLLATALSASSFGLGLYQLSEMLALEPEERAFTQKLFSWISVGTFNVDAGLLLDQLSICFVLLITGVGTLIHIYSISYMSHDRDRRRFFAYLNLFIAAMLLLVLGDSYLNLYVGWEGVGLASYLLIGFWNQKPAYATASKKAFVMNRIGDMGLSFAIMIAFATLGTVSFSGVKQASETASTATLTGIGIMLLVAAAGKSAQFPLQAWLGDAMAGPTPVSALIHAATMVTAGVYLITRSNFIFDAAPTAQLLVVIVGADNFDFWCACRYRKR
jgi:NADH-quinone oxidoreductase subunit L